MSKKLFIVLFLFCFVFVAFGGAAVSEEMFVSQNGNDADDGSESRPFKTIDRAKKQLDEIIGGGFVGTVTVNIREGIYNLEAPLVFKHVDGPGDILIRGRQGLVGHHG